MRRFILGFILVIMIMAIIGKFVNKDDEQEYPNSGTFDATYQDSGSAEFVEEYAGGYTVELDNVSSGYSTEAYALKNDGTATWMYITMKGGNAEVTSKKQGTWVAQKDRIEITIRGNTGLCNTPQILDRRFS
jgi:hypothetical protein